MSARLIYAASLALHVVVGSAVASTRPAPARRTVVVEVRRARPRTPPPAPTPPPPAPTPAPTPAPVAAPAARATPSPARSSPPRAAPRAAPANAAPATGPGLAVGAPHDFGLALGNDTGGNGTGGGGGEGPATPAPAARAAHAEEACEGAPTRPRVISMEQPEYPDAAREAEIEGRVRVELHVDETGAVTSARVLEGLGHGLDEAALAAARAARFEPATRCGRPVDATFTVGVRFAL